MNDKGYLYGALYQLLFEEHDVFSKPDARFTARYLGGVVLDVFDGVSVEDFVNYCAQREDNLTLDNIMINMEISENLRRASERAQEELAAMLKKKCNHLRLRR